MNNLHKKHDDFIRELIHKSWHRGCKETDILLGQFARNHISEMPNEFLELYSSFILESDWDIYAWLTGEAQPPQKYLTIIAQVQSFHFKNHKK